MVPPTDRNTDSGPPKPLSEDVRQRFRRQKTRDTAPEVALRRELHSLGLRYRVNLCVLPDLRRRPDVIFTARRVAVFVDGCFWHRCPAHAIPPKNNASWWAEKLQRTVDRDRDTDRKLDAAGWKVVRVWEHEDPREAARRVREVVVALPAQRRRRPAAGSQS